MEMFGGKNTQVLYFPHKIEKNSILCQKLFLPTARKNVLKSINSNFTLAGHSPKFG